MLKSVPASLLAVLLLVACGKTPTRPDPGHDNPARSESAAQTELPGPNDNLNAVAWTQTAVERELIYRQTYRAAGFQLDRALADADWEALARNERKGERPATLKPAVILDIDETVLDNSPYQARLVVNGNSYNEFTWSEWCREENAAGLPGALEFTRLAASKGVTVFYLSNRASDLGEATLANLRKLGFPVATDREVFLGLGTFVPGCEQNGSDKSCRRELIARDYRVLMQFGDQLGDFIDVMSNSPEARAEAVAPYLDWVGERWFVLPNPTYGHWESALFNNDWSQSAEVRREAKLRALKTGQ
ncbi:5'-nucleotidase, lipoprotein e(P4) family [Dokdonella sp.]|uniref:5'-nucleotidase, lipoprotein e(P4) family n=1 Tax=Dokdonella sp. TaxID=2291710 RepID=UPI003526D45F